MPILPPERMSRPSRRQAIVGLSTLAVGTATIGLVPRLCAQQRPDVAILPDFRRAGDRDDTAALLRAVETGLPIHAPAGRYAIAMSATDDLPSNFRLSGDGIDATIFTRSYARAAPFILHADSRSAAPDRNLTGWRIADLRFEDDVARRGFSEHDYLVMLSGVTDARFARVGFRGFRGDGLYLGSSTIRADERHNRDVRITDCTFNGVNTNNRNAITIIDCDGLVIEDCRFVDVGRPGNGTPGEGDPMNPLTGPAMPGVIDFEPDEGFSVIRNAIIRRNRFEGGGGFAVNLSLTPNTQVRVPRQGFTIENNVIVGRRGAFAASGYAGDDATRVAPGFAVTIRRNQVSRTDKPFLVQGMRGLAIDGNVFTDCAEMAELGYQAANADVRIADNRFVRVGLTKGYGLWIRALADSRIVDNEFVDCGLANGQQGIAIAFFEGRANGVAVIGNRFSSPARRTTLAMKVFAEAQLSDISASANRVSLTDVATDPTLGLARWR